MAGLGRIGKSGVWIYSLAYHFWQTQLQMHLGWFHRILPNHPPLVMLNLFLPDFCPFSGLGIIYNDYRSLTPAGPTIPTEGEEGKVSC